MLYITIVVLSLYIAWSDISERRIPNISQYVILLVGFISQSLNGTEPASVSYLVFPGVILIVGAALSHYDIVGFGDIKLIFTTLLVTKADYYSAVMLFIAFSGGIWAVLWRCLLCKIPCVKKVDRIKHGIPYGIPIVISLCLFTFIH